MGVEYILWDLGGKTSLGADQLWRTLIEERGLPLTPTEALHPVVCLDTDFLPIEHFYDPSQAVRIMPDDWPAFAEQAWATIELALGDKRIDGPDRGSRFDLNEAGKQEAGRDLIWMRMAISEICEEIRHLRDAASDLLDLALGRMAYFASWNGRY